MLVLSPWPHALPLTRAWCLWEMFCSYDVQAEFNVVFGPEERAAFARGLLLDGYEAVAKVFALVDVATARAGNPRDERMIKDAVRTLPSPAPGHPGGFECINELVVAKMQEQIMAQSWALEFRGGNEFILKLRSSTRQNAVCDSNGKRHGIYPISTSSYCFSGARKRFRVSPKIAGAQEQSARVVEEAAALLKVLESEHGARSATVLVAKLNFARLLEQQRRGRRGGGAATSTGADLGEAERLYREVATTRAEALGPGHPLAMEAKLALANLLAQLGSVEAASHLQDEVRRGQADVHSGCAVGARELALVLREAALELLEGIENVYTCEAKLESVSHPCTVEGASALLRGKSLAVDQIDSGIGDGVLPRAQELVEIRDELSLIIPDDRCSFVASKYEVSKKLRKPPRQNVLRVSFSFFFKNTRHPCTPFQLKHELIPSVWGPGDDSAYFTFWSPGAALHGDRRRP